MGFTLVEVLIVIIIIAILTAIAIPIYSDVSETSRNTVCKYNATYIVKVLALNLADYDREDWYAPRNSSGEFDYSEDSLNNFLEKNLESYQVDSNKDKIVNPVSRSEKIINSNTPGTGDDRNAAVFITGNPSYSFSGGGDTINLQGSIVVYFSASEPYNIQVYYIGKTGNKVEMVVDYR